MKRPPHQGPPRTKSAARAGVGRPSPARPTPDGGSPTRPSLADGLDRAKREVVLQLTEAIEEAGLSKTELARRMGTSRSSLDRLLDGGNPSVTLATLGRAARALGRRVRIALD